MALSKWEQKQAAAKAAEAKFEDNQRRLAKHKAKRKRGSKAELEDVGSALGDVEVVKGGVLGWLLGNKAVLGILAVLLAGGVIFGICKIQSYQMRNAPGSPRSELFVAGTLIVIDHVEIGGSDSKGRPQQATAKGDRLTAIDAETGKQLAVDVSDYKECWAGGSRVVCANIYDQIEILDPRTLATAGTANDLIAAAKLAKPTRRYQRDGEGVIVVLEDGRGAQIDPATLAVKSLDTVQSAMFPSTSSDSCSVDSRRKFGDTTLIMQSGTRNTLTSDPPPPAESPKPSGPALSFLDGGFLREVDAPVVLHKETMDKPDQVVSRVNGISTEMWSFALRGACRRVWIHNKLLVVATGDPEHRGIGLDLATGQMVWSFGR